jgi:hypothetical protein
MINVELIWMDVKGSDSVIIWRSVWHLPGGTCLDQLQTKQQRMLKKVPTHGHKVNYHMIGKQMEYWVSHCDKYWGQERIVFFSLSLILPIPLSYWSGMRAVPHPLPWMWVTVCFTTCLHNLSLPYPFTLDEDTQWNKKAHVWCSLKCGWETKQDSIPRL